jgi:hypothetical protein
VHKTANVLNKLPKSQQSKAKRALQEIWMAETKKDALAAFDVFVETWGVKYDKAVECLVKDRDALLAFYDFPAEHWKHLRTTNVIATAAGLLGGSVSERWSGLSAASATWGTPVARKRTATRLAGPNLTRSGHQLCIAAVDRLRFSIAQLLLEAHGSTYAGERGQPAFNPTMMNRAAAPALLR